MTFRDRTNEFTALTETIKTNTKPNGAAKKKKKQESSQFVALAGKIGRDIAATSEKLDRLTKLAKKKSLFDDPTVEIQRLTDVINQDIKNLNSQITFLQEQQDSYNKKGQVSNHAETIVKALKTQLRTTTKGFTEILELRTENLKQQQKERETFTGSLINPSFSKRTVESPLYKPTVSHTYDESAPNGSEVVIAMPQSVLLTQDRYLTNRADAVANIERTISELQNIFRQLASLVAEQGELIERIDHNAEMTLVNVTSAQDSLLKYLSSLKSNRMLMVKIFLVLILFVIIFVVFFV